MSNLDTSLKLKMVAIYHEAHNLARVARNFSVNVKTASLWVNQLKESSRLEACSSLGRKGSMSEMAARKATELILRSSYGGLEEIAKELHRPYLKEEVHCTKISRHAKAQAKADGYSIYGVQTYMPTQLVTAETMSKRLSFAEANKAQCWDGVMITGYKKFLFSYAGTSASFFKIKLRILWIL